MIRSSQLLGHRLWTVVLVATVLFTGCSATYQVALDRPPTTRNDTLSLSRLNSRLSDVQVTVHRVGGSDLQGTYEACDADSCRFLLDSAAVQAIVPTSEIKTIEYADHWSGLLGGLLAGFAGFFIIGSLGVLIGDRAPNSPVVYVFLLGALASLIGLPIIGGVDGIPNTIVFPGDSRTSTVLEQPDTVRMGMQSMIPTASDSLSQDSSGGRAGQSPP